MLNSRSLLISTVVGTLLQVAMVTLGHTNPAIKNLFAVGGMGFSLVAGLLYALLARGTGSARPWLGGLIAGAVCAFLGILISYLLADVPMSLLALGTLSSAVTGALGGLLGGIGDKSAASRGGTSGRRAATIIAALTISASTRSNAQSTTSPTPTKPATLADFAWLAGTWHGTVAGVSGVAEVTYSTPKAGLMTGMMRLVSGDTAILMVEFISLVETPTSVDMRFRHFSPSLAAYEPDFKQQLQLTAHSATRDIFENTVPFAKGQMATETRTTSIVRRGNDEYTAHADVMGDDGKMSAIDVVYRRVK